MLSYLFSIRIQQWIMFFLCLNILDCILFLFNYSFKYTDGDQCLAWIQSQHYASVNFHDIYFIGQKYNIALEALLSAPFVKMGLQPMYAMPLVTCVLSILPFVLFAYYFYKKKLYEVAFIFVIIPLVLPSEYQMVSFAPRGFVTGLAVSSIGIFGLLTYTNFVIRAIAFFLIFFSVEINPNSVLLTAPLLLYVFLQSNRKWNFVWNAFVGLFVAMVVLFFIRRFYVQYPHYIVHEMKALECSLSNFAHVISNINNITKTFFPAVFHAGIGALFILVLFLFFIFKRGFTSSKIASLFFIMLFVCTWFVNKISDGTANIDLPYYRMYLAIPILYGWFYFFANAKSFYNNKSVFFLILFLVFSGFILKWSMFPVRAKRSVIEGSSVVCRYEISKLIQLKQFVMNDNLVRSTNLIIHDHSLSHYFFSSQLHYPVNIFPFYERLHENIYRTERLQHVRPLFISKVNEPIEKMDTVNGIQVLYNDGFHKVLVTPDSLIFDNAEAVFKTYNINALYKE